TFDYFRLREQHFHLKELQRKIVLQKIQTQQIIREVQTQNTKLQKLEEFDRKLRIITDFQEPIPGLQFEIQDDFEDSLDLGLEEETYIDHQNLLSEMNRLAFSMNLREISFYQLESYMQDSKDRLARTPSIAPVKKGYIT